ncbi:hypothetical protein CFN78_19935 [Amycolatopsis antarctica]|uniref:Uncharacterized protein n=1 Tax=Amycolatopsis antarctica TaxID=1854586 RepID=A0A263CZK4_9PSEU|nr:hypothetical protein CFN78_19935 [Amycolatopsis antarctica]
MPARNSTGDLSEPEVIPRSPVAKMKLFFRLHWRRGAPGQPTPPWVMRYCYRTWLVALAFKLVGSSWDMSWHFKWLRDDLAPPHLINSVGTVMVCVLVAIHSFTGMGVDRRALRLMQVGTTIFLIAAPLDVINHSLNGLDITSWSPTHGLLYLGTAIMTLGAIDGWLKGTEPGRLRTLVSTGLWIFFLENMFFPNGQQEYGILSLRAWDRGAPTGEQTLLQFAADDIGRPIDREAILHFALPIDDWVYPVWGIGVMALVLAAARHTIGKMWAATAVATGYVLYRAVIWPLLMWSDFPTSTVPFYLIGVGLAVDLAFRVARGHRTFGAGVGALLVTAFGFGALWLQGQLRPWLLGDAVTESAPPIGYWTVPVVLAGVAVLWALATPVAGWWEARTRKRRAADLLPGAVT